MHSPQFQQFRSNQLTEEEHSSRRHGQVSKETRSLQEKRGNHLQKYFEETTAKLILWQGG